jgi:hypothetical protein
MLEEVIQTLDKATRLDEGKAFLFAVDSDVRQLIIDLNTKDQLGIHGVDSNDERMRDYAAFTVRERASLGLQTDHVDFKVTGDYWGSWTITANEREIEITVDRERFSKLVNELGFPAEHVGLTEKNLNKLTALMLTKYQEFVKKELGL